MKCSEDCLNIDYVFRKISVSSLSPNLCIFDWMPWKRNLFTISKNASLITIHEHRLVSNPNTFVCFFSVSRPVSETAEKLFFNACKIYKLMCWFSKKSQTESFKYNLHILKTKNVFDTAEGRENFQGRPVKATVLIILFSIWKDFKNCV